MSKKVSASASQVNSLLPPGDVSELRDLCKRHGLDVIAFIRVSVQTAIKSCANDDTMMLCQIRQINEG